MELRAATTRDMTCPNCGGHTDIRFAEWIWRSMPCSGIQDGVLMFDTAGDKVEWEAAKDAVLYCCACNKEFAIPEDIRIDFE